ncbi:nucleoside triphosphate pyrophosphohydrolase [Magnetovibrio sp. PR-2]|uniref:nucleoside triphosphate pyrophosphohydrolase n=1 Tax=Magnetovibrio sp. PR-2 TaxID=3120356 RepID=UPI002FCE3E64
MTDSSRPLPSANLEGLLELMAQLRAPDGGCPWDLEQTFATIAPHTIEEAYEVADAIDSLNRGGDMAHLKDELGDLLFQVVFYAQMAKEQGDFDFHDIAAAITQKMIRRHPHVFGEQSGIDSADDQTVNWEALKEQERKAKAENAEEPHGVLDDVSHGYPALMRANKLQKRAARVGFDWPDTLPVIDKIHEEIDEVKAEIDSGDREALEAELGDLLFACVNLARKTGIDPETALRSANSKFETRFKHIEHTLWDQGKEVQETPLDELDRLWNEAKSLQKET